MEELFAEFIARLSRDQIAQPDDLIGCTDVEIAALESAYGLTLPASYRTYLRLMGRDAGRLFKYDHFNATCDDALIMTRDEREFATEDGLGDKVDAALGAHGLIILGRLSEYFFFVRCDGGDNPPIYGMAVPDYQAEDRYTSMIDLLNAIADECAEAVRSGYFGSGSA